MSVSGISKVLHFGITGPIPKYCMTEQYYIPHKMWCFTIFLAHQDNQNMLDIYQKIAETTDRHGRNVLHLALVYQRFDFYDFGLEKTNPDLLARLILSKYMPRGLTVLHEVIDHQ